MDRKHNKKEPFRATSGNKKGLSCENPFSSPLIPEEIYLMALVGNKARLLEQQRRADDQKTTDPKTQHTWTNYAKLHGCANLVYSEMRFTKNTSFS